MNTNPPRFKSRRFCFFLFADESKRESVDKITLKYSFEQLVKDHVEQVKRALGIASVLTQQSSWFVTKRTLDACSDNEETGSNDINGAQIDLLIDRRDRAINVCEAKFSGGEFVIDKDYSLKLRNKLMAFKAATKTYPEIG